MSKRISVQWRITILTALLIAAACVSLNLLLFYSCLLYTSRAKGVCVPISQAKGQR